MSKVSIVLPNYNYARYLDERIQSLLNQTYSDFELIILDDASTDNSVEVIEKYTNDPRVKTKFYTENSGLPYKRWNDGADMAQGEYLLIAGADDSCEPNLLEQLVEKLDRHPSVGLALSQSWVIDSDGDRICSMKMLTDSLKDGKERWEADFVDTGKNELKYLLRVCTIPNASCVLMRREIFIKAGKFDENFTLTADWILWSKMLMISDIAFISDPLNYFRTHPQTIRSRTSKNGVEFEEMCLTKKFIIENSGLSFSSDIIDQAFDFKWEWIRSIIDSPNRISFERNIRIYQHFSQLDWTIGWFLLGGLFLKVIGLRQFIRYLWRKFYVVSAVRYSA